MPICTPTKFLNVAYCWQINLTWVAPALSFPLDKYIIFYRPSSNGVEIVRILHGSRNIESLFKGE